MKAILIICFAAGTVFGGSDYEPGVYHDYRERAANALRNAPFPNRMFEKLSKGEMARGAYIDLKDPSICELAGRCGLDWVWIDMEHKPITLADLLAQQSALEGTGCASIIRVRSEKDSELSAILDLGVDAIVFPQISSVEQAKEAAGRCRYPMAGGTRGICFGRQLPPGMDPKAYLKRSETWPLVIIEVEDLAGVKAVDEIVKLDSVDGIMVGPSDLSCTLGGLYSQSGEKIDALLKEVSEKTRQAGKFFFGLGGKERCEKLGSALYMTHSDVSAMTSRWQEQ